MNNFLGPGHEVFTLSNQLQKAGAAFLNNDAAPVVMSLAVFVGDGGGGVKAYDVGTYGELSSQSIGDGLTIDHIPSNASNLARATAAKGEALTPAEATAVREQRNGCGSP